MTRYSPYAVLLLLVASQAVVAQQPLDLATVADKLNKDGQMTLAGGSILLKKYDFTHDGETVEAITFRPVAAGKYPAVMLIPGYSRTALDYVPLGLRLAREGYACVSISPRGFGKSTGKPDFVGPKTIDPMEACFRRFSKEDFADPSRMALFGYSRGAMAASLLSTRLTNKELHAAIFAAGIYDFKKAYDEVTLQGIKDNMEKEAGLSDEAVKARSSIYRMDKLPCPVLILHGEKDNNAPINQAHLLKDELAKLNKPHELKTFPDKDHDHGRQNLNDSTISFLNKHLKSAATK